MNSAETVQSVNPATEDILGSFPLHSDRQIEEALQRAQKTYMEWKTSELGIREFVNIQTVWIGPPK